MTYLSPRTFIKAQPRQKNPHSVLLTPNLPNTTHSFDIQKYTEKFFKKGIRELTTAPLSLLDANPFLEAGFVIEERLHLLTMQLPRMQPIQTTQKIYKSKPWNRKNILSVDNASFNNFWRFDNTSLRSAQKATPQTATFTTKKDRNIVGYIVVGKAASQGYIQRIAVHPNYENQGHGTSLLSSAIAWLSTNRARRAYINTQETNQKAFNLYQKVGFEKQPEGLVVLRKMAPI